MINPTAVIPGVIFYSFLSGMRKEKCAFLEDNTLVLQVSGRFTLQTATEKVVMSRGQMMLIRKHQLAELTKIPVEDNEYQTIIISLKEDLLRQIALEEQIEVDRKWQGPSNVLIPGNDFLRAFFQSLLPYVQHPQEKVTTAVGILKVKEAIYLLLDTMPELKDLLFDFSEPHKIDLQKFMLTNFHYNVPVDKFARLTGRSLAGFKRDFQKTFGMAPRQWLLEKRLSEARFLMEKKNKKPSEFYLDLGFESLSHFSHSFKKKYGMAPTEMVI
ncbi:AraC-type DNA-binding protein [Chitinophaga terrae (ex Kim and Jung 2007)]|uniref:AraC-type DNA-binding protein n=1 Tax=Chitinophaga terrae (ex Kim and Jung 2007) TaxID=408074 RepID=A0A1H4GDH3_9BACT|nr:AraC family transcriptional regulator [Chitinophaga terrae (ex Kim and Jung 2007)]SEB07683.1 AraC-type DNA-binding protein [Chitinophaga terrae (ex Kim and Jung 2007)]